MGEISAVFFYPRRMLPNQPPYFLRRDAQAFTHGRTKVRHQGMTGGQIREPRRDGAPPDRRAAPKAPHRAFAAISELYGDAGFAENGLYMSAKSRDRPRSH